MQITTFEGCMVQAVPVQFPDGTEGKIIMIVNTQTGDRWQVGMGQDIADQVADQLRGSGKLTVAPPSAIDELRRNGHSGRN